MHATWTGPATPDAGSPPRRRGHLHNAKRKLPMNPVKGTTALALLALALGAAPNAMHAQNSSVGTVIVAHGADAAWNAQVESVAAAARTGGPVAVSFLMGPGAKTARFQDV